MSFSFIATDQEWSDDYESRVLRAVSVHRGDVSIVTQGANTATTAEMRALEAALSERGSAGWDAFRRRSGPRL
jgi:hypothetical protein